MTDDQIRRSLDELRGQLKGLSESVGTSNAESREARARLYERVDSLGAELRTGIVSLKSQIDHLEKRVDQLEPVAATVTDWKAQRKAFLWLIGGIGGVITAGTAMGNVVVSLLKSSGG